MIWFFCGSLLLISTLFHIAPNLLGFRAYAFPITRHFYIGELIKFGYDQRAIYPSREKQTEDYITGRYG